MKQSDINAILLGTGLPVAYHHFDGAEGVEPPYIVFRFIDDPGFHADGVNFAGVASWQADLWTSEKDVESERLVRSALDGAGIAYSQIETYVKSERAYMHSYLFGAVS